MMQGMKNSHDYHSDVLVGMGSHILYSLLVLLISDFFQIVDKMTQNFKLKEFVSVNEISMVVFPKLHFTLMFVRVQELLLKT